MIQYSYNDTFYAYQQAGSFASARAIVPLILKMFRPRSVLDVGCGAGGWIRAYLAEGISDILGIDGDYMRPEQLTFDRSLFRVVDVSRSFSLGRQFDVVQCLEVGEHIPPSASEVLVDSLVAHGEVVVFSAATPGQGGENHVNERDYEYWRTLFALRRYRVYDPIRPSIRGNPFVENWYRYNILVFIREDAGARYQVDITGTRILEPELIPDVAPFSYRLRRRVLSLLPVATVTRLAVFKHWLMLKRAQSRR